MVGCGTALLNAVHLAELLDEVAFKVPALVRVEATRPVVGGAFEHLGGPK